MVKIRDLTGINSHKRKNAIICLDSLLSFKDEDGNLDPIISGYNWYSDIPNFQSTITFTNIHETEAYKKDMLRDLETIGYNKDDILKYIRKKGGAFLHGLEFSIRDKQGNILPELKIKDTRIQEYLDLNKFKKPLINYPEFFDAEGFLLDENEGWELNMPFRSKNELLNIIQLFLKKSGLYIHSFPSKELQKNYRKNVNKFSWSDAHDVPVLLLGKSALNYKENLPQFVKATKISLKENFNEISFIIHKKIMLLKKLPIYKGLIDLGFKEETCLGNRLFINYINDTRKV